MNYNSKKITTIINSKEIVFDSPIEYKYYFEVLLPKINQGLITQLEFHKTFTLFNSQSHISCGQLNEINYSCDFYYYDKEINNYVVIEIKGYPTPDYQLRKNVFLHLYPTFIFKEIRYVNNEIGFVEYKKGQSIKLLRRRLRKEKENTKNKEIKKYERLKNKVFSKNMKERYTLLEKEFILSFNEKYKKKYPKKYFITL